MANLIKPLADPKIAGTYGRQVPTENSDPLDVRDLVMLFRNESFVQSVDSFFHNANSAFLKSTWNNFLFVRNLPILKIGYGENKLLKVG